MSEKKKRKQLSRSAKMYAKGKRPVLIWLALDEMVLLKAAAEFERRPVAQFVKHYALVQAGKTHAY